MKEKTALIFNMPAPYRERIFELVYESLHKNFIVLFCQKRESDRKWNNIDGKYGRLFLKERVFSYHNYYERYVHTNPDVWKRLNEIDPDNVITYGYNPTYLIAFLWCKVKGKKHVVFSDVGFAIDNSLTWFHRVLRRLVIASSQSFIAASDQAKDLLIKYGAKENKTFHSYLCANNDLFFNYKQNTDRKYDLMFSARFISSKMPLFFCRIAKKVKEELGDVRVLMLGDGPLKKEVIAFLDTHQISYEYPGFVKQEDLPKYYHQAKLFLFPTQIDCWGVVLNEACAAGVPVLTTDQTAAAGELVQNNVNGYVLPVDEDLWTEKCIELLSDKSKRQSFSNASLKLVEKYSYENAAKGIVDAIEIVSVNK